MSTRVILRLVAGVAVLGLGLVLPFSTLGTANTALLNALIAASLVVLTGWIGQISLAQAAFVGLGAFATAVAVRSFGLAFPATVVLGAVVAMVAATVLGVVALRVRGLYLAVATLIFAWMAQGYLFNLPELVSTGGSSIAETKPLGDEGAVPYLDFTERRTFYYVLLATVGASLLAMANLRDSKTGRSYFAVKGSEVAAASLGIDVTAAKLSAFAVSGFLAGLAGSLLMTHQSVASVTQFTVEQSLFYLSVAVVGGVTSLGGALASGTLFASLRELFYNVPALDGFLLIVSTSLLAVVLLFFPAGLAGIPGQLRALGRRLGLPSFVERVRSVYGRLRERSDGGDGAEAPPTGALPDETDRIPTERGADADTPVAVIADDRLPASLARVIGEAREVVRRLGARGAWLARRGAPGGAPDALIATVAAELERVSADVDLRANDPAGLVYVPGTATKLRLPPRARRTPVLQATDITVRFGGLTAVEGVSLEVREGEITALIGPNGAGKTTLFNAVSGLNQPTSGRVELFGHDVTGYPVHERSRMGMGRTFQVLQLFPELTVFDNLMVATHQRNPTGFFSHLAATATSVAWEVAARQRVRQVIDLMGLHDEAERQVAGLPFGRLRLVELARALVTGSPFVMLDEPASGLDNTETDAFMDLLLWVRERMGVTMLLIEHDMRVVMSLADYAYVIDRGKKIAEGTTKRIQRDPRVIAAYLGAAPTGEGSDSGDGSTKGRPRAQDGRSGAREAGTRSRAAAGATR